MLKKITLTTILFSFFLNTYGMESGLSPEVFKKRELENNKEEYNSKIKLIKDSEIMTIEQLETKYSPEEINYIKRINEVYENNDIINKNNLKSKDKLKGIQ